MGKNQPAKAGDSRDVGSIPGLGRSPGGGDGNPLQYSCLKKSHGQRSLMGYSPRGHKESDTTEHAHIHTHLSSKFILSLFTLLNLNFLSCYQIKRPDIFIVKDTVYEYNCIILGGKVWKDMNQTVHGFLTVILPDSRIDAARLSFFTL